MMGQLGCTNNMFKSFQERMYFWKFVLVVIQYVCYIKNWQSRCKVNKQTETMLFKNKIRIFDDFCTFVINDSDGIIYWLLKNAENEFNKIEMINIITFLKWAKWYFEYWRAQDEAEEVQLN